MRYKETVVAVQGHSKELYCSYGVSRCGNIDDGVSFRFEGEGCWVIGLDELKRLVTLADKYREDQLAEILKEDE